MCCLCSSLPSVRRKLLLLLYFQKHQTMKNSTSNSIKICTCFTQDFTRICAEHKGSSAALALWQGLSRTPQSPCCPHSCARVPCALPIPHPQIRRPGSKKMATIMWEMPTGCSPNQIQSVQQWWFTSAQADLVSFQVNASVTCSCKHPLG